MFGWSWGEIVLIGAVALIVIGPKELPAVLRTVGQWTTKIRRMAAEFQSQFQEALREAEMADLKKEVDNIADSARGLASSMTSQFDPLTEATKWEPKIEDRGAGTAADSAKAETPDAPKTDAVLPAEAAAEPPPVTPDGYVPQPTDAVAAGTAPVVPPEGGPAEPAPAASAHPGGASDRPA